MHFDFELKLNILIMIYFLGPQFIYHIIIINMTSIAYSELLARFTLVPRKSLNFLTPIDKIEGLFVEQPTEP